MKKHKRAAFSECCANNFYNKLELSRKTRRPSYSSQAFADKLQIHSRLLSESSEPVFMSFIASLWAQDVLIIELWRLDDVTSKKRMWRGRASASSPALVSPASRKWNFAGTVNFRNNQDCFITLCSFLSDFMLLITPSGENISAKHTWSFFFFFCLKSVQAVLAPHRYDTAFKATIKPPTSERNRFQRAEEAAKMTTY